jgi:hypothetical protein
VFQDVSDQEERDYYVVIEEFKCTTVSTGRSLNYIGRAFGAFLFLKNEKLLKR